MDALATDGLRRARWRSWTVRAGGSPTTDRVRSSRPVGSSETGSPRRRTHAEPDVDTRYSEPEATATSWQDAAELLGGAELSWLTSVRPDGTPHVTPLITVMHEGTLHFCTGPGGAQGAQHRGQPGGRRAPPAATRCTAAPTWCWRGSPSGSPARSGSRALADAWVAKYGEEWRFEVSPDAFRHPGGDGEAWVYAVRATTAFGFGKAPYSQTRWRFDH